MKVTLRVDEIDDKVGERLEVVLKHDRIIKALVYKEEAEKTKKLHYQGYVEFNDEHHGWWKQRWSTAWKSMKPHEKSTNKVQKETYLGYIAKTGRDGNQPFYNYGHTDEEIAELVAKNVKGDKKYELVEDGERKVRNNMSFEDRMWATVVAKFYDNESGWTINWENGFVPMRDHLLEQFPWLKGGYTLFVPGRIRQAINWSLARIDTKGWMKHMERMEREDLLSQHGV